jgi:hypothetical protein
MRSSWRPAQRPTTKNMGVHMVNALTTIFTGVEHNAIARIQPS